MGTDVDRNLQRKSRGSPRPASVDGVESADVPGAELGSGEQGGRDHLAVVLDMLRGDHLIG
jgi:hypothetical protein